MRGFIEGLSGAMRGFFSTENWWYDVLDILIVTLLIYELILLVRRTRAVQLIKGTVLVVVAYLASEALGLKTVTFIFRNVLQIGLLAMVVVFQPEVRRALEQMGRDGFSILSNKLNGDQLSVWHRPIVSICESVKHMGEDRIGALIVIGQRTGLNEIVGTGTTLDSAVTSELIETIFYPGSPLHDGAVIIENGRIKAAGCLLPLSSNLEIGRDMGTRHRAALGMSENSDAVVIVVSEETGIISVAQNGIIVRKLDETGLFRMLSNELMTGIDGEQKKTGWRRFWR